MRRWKSSIPGSSTERHVEVQIDTSSDESERPVQPPPKRRRGRPKATCSSWEFDAPRAPPPNFPNRQAFTHANATGQTSSSAPVTHSTPPQDFHPPSQVDEPAAPPSPKPDHNKQGQKKTRKTPNDNLREWLDSCVDKYLHEWYSHDAPPTSSCCLCDRQTDNFHRCVTCLGAGIICLECLVRTHRNNPTHRFKTWDGSSWEDRNISDKELGYCLFLGHGGKECKSNKDTWNLLVGDLNGFTPIRVHYCTCEGHAPRTRQLLQAGLFPVSHRLPESAMTLQLLEMYDLLTTVGRTSGHKYYSVLAQFTRPGFPSEVEDRYRKLMWTHRRYMFLSQLRRFGDIFPSHPDIEVHVGDQAVDCVSCPRPGINFEWHEVVDGEREYFRIWISYDGNARSVRKAKRVDHGDICLSDGKAYFPPGEAYKQWTESVPQPKRAEKPDCDNHKAGNVTSVRWVGRNVTGVGMFSCTSHLCILPRGASDFYKGERFAYADHALGSLLTYILKRHDEALLVGITYDVWCHYVTNIWERVKHLPPSIMIPLGLSLIGAIPKWHLVGHERDCYVRYSLDNMQYVGWLEGEGVERFWAHLNQLSGSCVFLAPAPAFLALQEQEGSQNVARDPQIWRRIWQIPADSVK